MDDARAGRFEREPSVHQWWRWPLVPFAAVFGAAVAAVICSAFLWFSMKFQGGYSEDGWYYLYIMPLIS